MDRRTFIVAVAVSLSATFRVTAQTAARVYRLGIVHSGTWVRSDRVNLGNWIPDALGELGYTEGQNLTVERKYADGDFERLPTLARELVQLRVEVILAIGFAPAKAAMDATTTIPIVLLSNGDPVAAGFVATLARPGGNVTSVLITPEGARGKEIGVTQGRRPRGTPHRASHPGGCGRRDAATASGGS